MTTKPYATEAGTVVILGSDSAVLRLGIKSAAALRQDLLGQRFRTTVALLAMMVRAEGMLLRVCSYCEDVLGVLDANGAGTGITHGICLPCARRCSNLYLRKAEEK